MLGSGRNSLVNQQRANTANAQAHGGRRPPRYGAQHAKQYGMQPVWRKSKQQQVDEKVSSLFESYRVIDKEAHAQRVESGF